MSKPGRRPKLTGPPKDVDEPHQFSLPLGEAERQMVIMALAELSVVNPGWDSFLCSIAIRIDNTNQHGRAEMYDQFRQLHGRATIQRILGPDTVDPL